MRTNGNDVLATYAVTRRSLDNARSGLGPTLVEAFTYRMGAHTPSDDSSRYRDSAHVEAWKAKDPIVRLRSLLERENHADASFLDDVDAEAKDLAAEWRRSCVEMPDPDSSRSRTVSRECHRSARQAEEDAEAVARQGAQRRDARRDGGR